MSKDIRSYFSISLKASGSGKAPTSKNVPERPSKGRKKKLVVSSDEDEVVPPTPEPPKKLKREKSREKLVKRRRVIESDDEDSKQKDAKPNLKKLKKEKSSEPDVPKKVVNSFSEMYNNKPVEMVFKKKKTPQKSVDALFESDDEFNQVAGMLDENDGGEKKLRKSKTPQKTNEKEKETAKKIPKKKLDESDFHSDEEFVKTVKNLDVVNGRHKTPKKTPKKDANENVPKSSGKKHKSGEKRSKPVEKAAKSVEKAPKSVEKSSRSAKKDSKASEKHSKALDKVSKSLDYAESSSKASQKADKTPKSTEKPHKTTEKPHKTIEKLEKASKSTEKLPKSAEKRHKTPEKTPKSTEKSKKHAENATTALKAETKAPETEAAATPEDKKKLAAIMYQKFHNRTSCINPGSKEVPQGAPNCLAGLSFIITGILESLQREEATQLIKDLGGRVMGNVSKKTDYVVLGEEAGPAKLKKIEEFSTKKLTEDGLFDLIREKSAGKIKMEDKKTPGSSAGKRKSAEPGEAGGKRVKKEEEAVKVDLNVTGSVGGKLPWVDKYAPSTSKQIIGQQGAASNLVKLTNWLTKWYSNHDGTKKLQRPSPWAKSDDGAFFKAALLSGPPGVGKTTTATLVCRELGFDVVEFNASDTRSKRLLKEQVSELLSNKSLFGFCHNAKVAVSKKHVLLMDEVDGMAGNEDRGGIQELIALIKDSSVPIICMCNDRNHQKMRSLVNYCYDLRFQRPRAEQIKGAMMSVCFKEKLKLAPGVLDEIIASTNHDVRQTLNILSMLNAKKSDSGIDAGGQSSKKDLKLGPWDVVRKVFSAEEQRKMSIQDRSDLFFHDYSIGPLFVQENYLSVTPRGIPKNYAIFHAAEAADSLSLGDLVDRRIRSNMAWSLLPTQAIFSSVLPGYYMQGFFTGQIEFPGWLGKNSKRNKRMRLAQEINDHIRITASGSRESVCMDYAPNLLAAIVNPLKEKGSEGVPDAINVMKKYRLLREDIEGLVELSVYPGKKNPLDGIDGKVKAALTRTYNKEVCPFVYSANAATKKKKAGGAADADEMMEGEDGEEVQHQSDEEEDDKIDNDALIKAKKRAPAKAKKEEPVASTSKGSTAKKGASSSKGKSSGKSKKK
ncbi:replication factor C subunit 1 [Lutzomyia longipalpis]|uniref:replication factor C subunit 1 n=1 Tax=Lutzomyia longipalpis TaxID=7200 RepID=UPI0024835FB9|nr:replication factor C subunit 1 [Lutzomyia longipalpis]